MKYTEEQKEITKKQLLIFNAFLLLYWQKNFIKF